MIKRKQLFTPSEFSSNILALGVLSVFIVVFFWDLIVSTRILLMRDMFFDFLPQHVYAGEIFRSWHIPLWSTYSGWGKPFAADPQTATFYPLHAMFYFLPSAVALRIYCLLHIWIAGAGMFLLARYWRLDVAPALVVAISCIFSSWMIGCMEFANNFAAIVWAPWILLTTNHLLKALEVIPLKNRKVRQFSVALIILFALQYLAGYPEFVAYTGTLTLIYIAAHCVYLRDSWLFLRSIAMLSLIGTGALLLSSLQLLLSWEFLPYSERAVGVDPGLQMASVHLRHLLGLILPFLNGSPGYPNQYWAGTVFEFWLGTCYVGILPLLMACCSLLCLSKRADGIYRAGRFLVIFFIAGGVFGLLMALGEHTPLYKLLWTIIPGFNRFRFPSKFLVMVLFSISFLAGFGYQALLDRRGDPPTVRSLRKIFLIGGGFFFCTILLGYLYAYSNSDFFRMLTGGFFPISPETVNTGLRDFLIALSFTILSIVALFWILVSVSSWINIIVPTVVFLNLFIVTRNIQPTLDETVLQAKPDSLILATEDTFDTRIHSIYPVTQHWLYGTRDEELLKWAIQAGAGDSWLRFHLHQTWQGGQKLMRYKTLYSLLGSLPLADTERLADTLGIGYVVGGEQFERILWGSASRTVQLSERKNARSRVYIVNDWIQMSDPDQILRTLIGLDTAKRAIIESNQTSPSLVLPMPTGNVANPGKVNWIKDNANRLDVEVNLGAQALVVINDAWYPGWKASVDGVVQPIFQTNFHFRGVFVGPGKHKIEMVFDPPLFSLGLGISAITAIALVLLVIL